MIILLLGCFSWIVNNIVRLTHLVLRIRYESPKEMFLLGNHCETYGWWRIFYSNQLSILSFYSTSIELQCRVKSCVLCKLPWSPKTKVNFCTLVCSPHLRLIYSLDHYFYVHLVFPLSLGHKFLGNKFCFPHFYIFHSVGYIVCAR